MKLKNGLACFPDDDVLNGYKNYDIGIPYEYEAYLKGLGAGQ